MSDDDKKPNPIDIHVGNRIRRKRKMDRMSQEKLAEQLGITFQQVQKYEKATNRIGASRLWEISEILSVPVSYFFEGLRSSTAGFAEESSPPFDTDFLSTAEGIQLNESFLKIKDPQVRKRILDLVKALSQE